MCGDGCAKYILGIMPGTSLENMKYKDIIVYDGRERMVVDVLGNSDINTTMRGVNNNVVFQRMSGYNSKTGKFRCNISLELGLSKEYSKINHTLDKSMREAGL